MSDRTTPWPVGAPTWVDISVTDLARSQKFYTDVLGWDYTAGGEEFGGYTNATLGGRVVAGMAPPMEGMEEPPHVWTTYLAVDDSGATQDKIVAAGGTVVMPPMQVGSFGTMAMYADPTGAVFGTWQAIEHKGFEVEHEPGAVAWSEAMVGDFEKGKAFYTEVFGWTYEDNSSDEMDYAIFTTSGEGDEMAGGIGVDTDAPQPYWSVVFAVDGTDEAVERVRAGGGGVVTEPFDFEHGRLAIVTGPDGEVLALLTEAADSTS